MKMIKPVSVEVNRSLLCLGLVIILSSCGGPSLDFDFDYDPDYKVKGQEKYPNDFSSGEVYGTVEVDEKTRQVKGYITTDEGDTVFLSANRQLQTEYLSFDYTRQLNGEFSHYRHEELSARFSSSRILSVQGDLNEQELEDIKAVIAEMDTIMDSLIKGDIDTVLSRAMGLLDEADSLSSLNAVLKFEQRTTLRHQAMVQGAGELFPPPPERSGPLFRLDELIDSFTRALLDFLEEDESKTDTDKQDPVRELLNSLLQDIPLPGINMDTGTLLK